MLQPRKRKFILKIVPKGLLLCVIILFTFTQNLNFAKGEDEKNGLIKDKIRRGERVIRHGDVNIVVLDDFERRKITPSLGLLSTTARTFIQEGTTTEFATHIYGTTVGDKYAHIVSTGSKIFYDNVRSSKDKNIDPTITIPSLDSLVFQSEENVIQPSKVMHEIYSEKSSVEKYTHEAHSENNFIPHNEEHIGKTLKSLRSNIPSVTERTPVTLNNAAEIEQRKIHNQISIRKEISVKPAKVKLKNELPTFTVKQDSPEFELKINQIQNSEFEIDNFVNIGNQVKHHFVPEKPELTTTTYYGFADFVTTAGNTVIIFTPQTKKPQFEGTVTSINGEATLIQSKIVPSVTIETSTSSSISELNEPEEQTESLEVTTLKETENEEIYLNTPYSDVETTESQDLVTESVTEITTEEIITTTNMDDLVRNKDTNDVPFLANSNNLESSFTKDIFPAPTIELYKTSAFSFSSVSETPNDSFTIESNVKITSTNSIFTTTENINEITTQSDRSANEEENEDEEEKDEDEVTETNDVTTMANNQDLTEKNENEEIILTTTRPNKTEEEVELIFKTLYTTYTYLTTYFEKSTTKIKSREEVVTNVITSTLDSVFLQQATDPAVAGLFSGHREAKLLAGSGIGRPTTLYHHSAELNDNEILSSSTDIQNDDVTKSTPSLRLHPRLTESSMKALYPSSTINENNRTLYLNAAENIVVSAQPNLTLKIRPHSSFRNTSRIPFRSVVLKHNLANLYKTTRRRIRPTELVQNEQVTKFKQIENSSLIEKKIAGNDSILSEEMSFNSIIVSAPLTSRTESTEQTPKKYYLNNDSDDDQLSQESNTEDTHPNPPLISLQTSYTTYTYFTTIYKGITSDIISRLETVTNVNTELIKPTSTESLVSTEDVTAPVTYYTTYTYWTTFYKDGSTTIQSRQETVSNVVFPSPTQNLITENIKPTQQISFTEPVTYYTTFTYFTTSYIGNSSIVNSHLETVANIIEASIANSELSVLENTNKLSKTDRPIFQPTGLISSALDTKVYNNLTTIFSTGIIGTYVDGSYSQLLEKSSIILTNPINTSSPITDDLKPTGTISIDEGKIIDAFGISTTFYTTKVIGTYIQQLYAELIESTSSVLINTEQHTNLFNPPTVVLNDKIYQTGILQISEGSIIKDGTTTFYETQIVGSVIDDQYSSLIRSSSSIHVEIIPTETAEIQATPTIDFTSNIQQTLSVSTSPSPDVVESSLNENFDSNEENEKDKNKSNKRKSSLPVLRPFASRSRPTFLPKKKTGERLSAATITRGITPTIVASPAVKQSETRVFGSGASRNRFAFGSRKSSPSSTITSEFQSATPNSRRFSRPKTNIQYTSTSVSQYNKPFSSRTYPTYSPSTSSYKRGIYRTSNTKIHDYISQSTIGSKFRIRPTVSGRSAYTSSASLKTEETSDELVTEQALSSSDDEIIETLPPSSTESSRKSLLRFRKPGSSKGTTIPTTTLKSTTQRRHIGVRRNDRLTTTKGTTTTRIPLTRNPNYINNKLRLKPANSLFPQKNIKKPELEVEDKTENIKDEEKDTEGYQETIEEVTENVEPVVEKSARNGKGFSPVSIKPFSRRGRLKRQAEFGYKYENIRGQKSRYRRPTVQNTFPDYLYYDEIDYTTEDNSARSANNRNGYNKLRNMQQSQQTYQQPFQQYQSIQQMSTQVQQPSSKIRPSPVSNSRTQFTLREKTQNTTPASQRSYRRPTTSSYRKYENNLTTKRARQRLYSTTTETTFYRNNRKQIPTRRTNSRSRYKENDYNLNTYLPMNFDGTITVTYKIPTEVTIPIVSGKVTEYKNVVTAKPSTQILAPHQYSTVTGKNGLTTLQLVAENSETMLNGIVEVTRYVIQEFPTSSITFTPTTIRGRKTSFSHVIPSTVYEVKPEVSTIPPQLNANAPLANLLLSQLLLGNLGIQPTVNPLLGLHQGSGVPITEYKTKTTSYVTTITHSTSTVIPVTFRGKEIKTTVIDSSTQVITATEYLTESTVITPSNTAQVANNQLNTLLLPALLQAQLLNQPLTTSSSNAAVVDENMADNLQLIQDNPTPSKVLKNGLNLENDNLKADDDYEQKNGQRKKLKNKSIDSPIEPAETSVVTLYLSGRRPGEFSTVLSTVTLDEEKSATLRKRNVDSVDPYNLKPSDISTLSSTLSGLDNDHFEAIIKSGINDISLLEADQETQSLESIVGDVSSYLQKNDYLTKSNKEVSASNKTLNELSNHFLLVTSTENAPFQWNSYITSRSDRKKRETNTNQKFKNMSLWKPDINWFEKINVKKTHTDLNNANANNESLENFESVSNRRNIQHTTDNYSLSVEDEGRGRYNLATKVMSNGVEVIIALDKSTLPGSPQLLRVLPTSIRPITLTPSTVTDHMIMMLPHGLQNVPNPFVTKTYLTTYTYLTTFLEEGVTRTLNKEKVISNVFTENVDVSNLSSNSPNADLHVTLSSSPIMATKVFQTTYNMETTVSNGNTPQIVVSQQTVSNTITAPGDFADLLQPSESNFNDFNSMSPTENVNEEFTVKPTEKLNTNLHNNNSDKSIEITPTSLQAADITKTYFVTYTYYSTLLENGSTVVKSNVATSSDVVTEKYYIPLKRTKQPANSIKETTPPTSVFISETYVEKPIHIFATKTYLTTFTYFTTLLQDKGGKFPQTVIRSRTKVVQNLVTETLNSNLLNSEYLFTLKNSLRKDSIPITATATLNDGQRIEITAVNENTHSTPMIDRISSSLEENQEFHNHITNYLEINEEPAKHDNNKTQKFNVSNVDSNNTNYSITTTILRSSTVIKNGATLLPGSQIIKFTDSTGNVSIIPVSDPVSKHPNGVHNQNKPDNKIQMNDFLNLGSLGINSLSALKPVINAMAGLWQNNIKQNVPNYESVTKPIRPYLNKDQIELNTNLKPPNRTPIYIPVGPVQEDNEGAESEDLLEQYPDVNQRNNYVSSNKSPLEKPLVSGGIPISPGQVINANTDVIVGTPAVLGPRPPIKNTNEKSDVPLGMRPPPLSQFIPNFSGEESEHGSFNYKFTDLIKVPPKPLSPAFLNNGFPLSNNIKYPLKTHHKHNVDQKISLPSEIKFSQLPANTPLLHVKENALKEQQTNIIKPAKLQQPVLIEHSSLNPLLVNVRPSQVAQVIIPHGSQTALIYSNEPATHNTKGEIFNDPSPYPEENVNPGFVGLKVYGPAYSEHPESTSKLSSNTIHLDIPINPFVADGTITESHHFVAVNLDGKPQTSYDVMSSGLKIPEELYKKPNNRYNFTSQTNPDIMKKPNYPTLWQSHDAYPISTEKNLQRPYIFPQNKPIPVGEYFRPTTEADIHSDYNLLGLDGDNEANDENLDSSLNDKDELTQETKIKQSSNSNLHKPINFQSEHNIKRPSEEQVSDYEINQNWEILKENPINVKSQGQNKTEIKSEDKNSTIRENSDVKYPDWANLEFPNYVSNEVNISEPIGNKPYFNVSPTGNSEKENNTKTYQKPASHNRNSQDNMVIGLSPPPLPQPTRVSSQKLPRPANPSLKPYQEHKESQRPLSKNKPKPTNPPYPFEKPNSSSTSLKPKPTVISKPLPNILYETDPPNFSDDLLKLKPLNTTGKIEPVKKWQTLTTTKPNGMQPVFGNIIKIHDPYKKEDVKSTTSNIIRNDSDISTAQTDAKIIVVEKTESTNIDKTTELISKWNEHGIISSSKNDFEENENIRNTPILESNRTKGSTVPNTIFGNLYTRPPPANIIIIPTHSTTQYYTAISMVIDKEQSSEKDPNPSFTYNINNEPITPSTTYPFYQINENDKDKIENKEKQTLTPTYYVTHTKTLSVTVTETTVVQRDGQPSTHTVVLTKTQTSTLIDTVTKIQTLLQPTSVLSTVTTTIPITISKETYSTISSVESYPTTSTSYYDEHRPEDNDSIFVVMTDKKSGTAHISPATTDTRPTGFEVQVPDEANEISPNDILFSGIYTQHSDNECRPECKVTKNEMCQKMDNIMRCVCRPGFARMFPDHPCKPTYTYVMRVPLDRQGADEIHYTDSLADRTSPSHQQLTEAARDGLDRMVMQSNLRDIYHGIVVSGFEPAKKSDKAAVVYIVQLSENAEETKLQDEIHKTLKANNYSLGGTDVFAAPDMFHIIQAEDFDECSDNKYHDCSEHAQCFNLRGTYTCSCKEGFTDMSYNVKFPGRVCSADAIGCELCNYHGTCYYKADENPTCECFQWYSGEFCQVNLKVTLISLIAIGILLSILLVVCLIMTCSKQKPPEILRSAPKPHVGFRRYRSVTNVPGDKRAIVSVDTSSEGSIERTPPPFVKKRILRNELPNPMISHISEGAIHTSEQRDRSLTVLIPRAKYRPVSSQPSSTLLTMSTFGPEQKLLNYAASRESSRTPEKKVSRCSMHSRRLSNSTNLSTELQPKKKISVPRRSSSGALVSAGFEVSATVRRTQELDEAYITQSHNDLNQPTYNSIRTVESSTIVDVPSLPVFESSLEEFITRVDKLGTVSEARSYDETTIQPPVRSLHHIFHSRTHTCDSKHSSSQKTNLDENHTMGERDLGSTYMPKSQLYKPDHRGSDGSNFDSL